MKVLLCAALALYGITPQIQGQCVNSNGPASQFGPEQTYRGVYKQDPVHPMGAPLFVEDGTGKVWVIEDSCALLYHNLGQHLEVKARVRTMATHDGTTIHLSVDGLVSVLAAAPAAPAPPTPAGQSPCSLLTAAQVTSALGISVKDGIESNRKGQVLCAWQTGKVGLSVPSFVILTWMSTADVAAMKPNPADPNSVQPHSGVGDAAFGQVSRGYRIFVRKGNKAFSLYIEMAGPPEPMQKLAPSAIALATEAAASL